MDAKKKSVQASERNEAARAAWWERISGIEPERFVWVDETGSNLGMTPAYSRAPRGQRAVGSAPRNRGINRTLVTSLSLAGAGPGLVLEGALNGAAFDAYVRHVLAPTLRAGQIVVLDNLSAHHGERARAAIEARGAELWFLPAYSPDPSASSGQALNPIEEAFSTPAQRFGVKALLRRAAARTPEALAEAIWAGLRAITAQDARGWVDHAGYLPRPRRSRRRAQPRQAAA